MAIAQPHTAGLTQSLLALLGIPLVLLISFLFLRKKPSWVAVAGAALIIAGTGTVAAVHYMHMHMHMIMHPHAHAPMHTHNHTHTICVPVDLPLPPLTSGNGIHSLPARRSLTRFLRFFISHLLRLFVVTVPFPFASHTQCSANSSNNCLPPPPPPPPLSSLLAPAFSAARPSSPSSAVVVFWYSVVLFAVGQIFLAGEKVYEEYVFRASNTDVMVMFCWTMWTQFFLGFTLYPLQTFKPFGGLVLDTLPIVIVDGLKCTAGITSNLTIDVGPGTVSPECDWFSTFIFVVYCVIDFTCYGLGLHVINKGGAGLLVIASSIALPLQQLTLCLPIMGKYRESVFWGDPIALVTVLAGFLVYQFVSPEGKEGRRTKQQ